jgi:hypothetical protein
MLNIDLKTSIYENSLIKEIFQVLYCSNVYTREIISISIFDIARVTYSKPCSLFELGLVQKL